MSVPQTHPKRTSDFGHDYSHHFGIPGWVSFSGTESHLIVKVVGRSWVILIVPRQVDWLLFHRSFKSWHLDYVFNSHLIDFERSKGWFFLTFAIPIAICLLCFVNLILLFLHEFKQLNIHIFSRLQEPLLLFKEMFRAHNWSFYSWAISWTNSHSHRFFNWRIDLHLWWERVAS